MHTPQVNINSIAENTELGNLQSHDLRHYYFGETEINDHSLDTLVLNNGVLQFKYSTMVYYNSVLEKIRKGTQISHSQVSKTA